MDDGVCANNNDASDEITDPTSVGAGACEECRSFLGRRGGGDDDDDSVVVPATSCAVCLGALSDEVAAAATEAVVRRRRPYGPPSRFCASAPSIGLPVDVYLRAYAYLLGDDDDDGDATSERTERYASFLKDELRDKIRASLANNDATTEKDDENDDGEDDGEDEDGLLDAHVALRPRPSAVAWPTVDLRDVLGLRPPPSRRRRKRWRGGTDDPTPRQGGDPVVNLESRTAAEDFRRDGETRDPRPPLSLARRALETMGRSPTATDALRRWFRTNGRVRVDDEHGVALDARAAVWRRRFYVRGRYVKNRRNVSQSPFYVQNHHGNGNGSGSGDHDKIVRVGVVSVEERVCDAVGRVACGGVSVHNNDVDGDGGDNVVYGACKFHASGREDVDVRMLGRGRPFCLEIVDALRRPTGRALRDAAAALGDDVRVVDDALTTARAEHFSRLQADTETKIKRYVCLCWSRNALPSATWLDRRLRRRRPRNHDDDDDDDEEISVDDPLRVVQATPVRVLHRRASADRIRYVVELKAELLNEHWFKLRVGTSAGTYVKEFVRGDLGRTRPSVADMIGGQVDILQLDVTEIDDQGTKFAEPRNDANNDNDND